MVFDAFDVLGDRFPIDSEEQQKTCQELVAQPLSVVGTNQARHDFMPQLGVGVVTLDPTDAKPLEVKVPDLKAVYFVRSLNGDPEHQKTNEFPPQAPAPGRKVKVTFKDGEVLVGTTQGYQPGRPGFFLLPADPRSNNERCYIVTSATQSVAFV